MRRISVVALIAMVCSALPVSAELLLSDVNADGQVNVLDLITVRNALGKDPAEGAANADRADVNGDGAVNILDMINVRNSLGAKEYSPPDNSPEALAGLDDAAGLSDSPVDVSLLTDYFPLQGGNYWLYQRGWGDYVWEQYRVEVLRRAYSCHYYTFYWLAKYFPHQPPAERLVCRTYSGNVYEWPRNVNALNLWYRLRAPVGTTWKFVLEGGDTCYSPLTATLAGRNETVSVPAGVFHDCVKIVYSGSNCADAGLIAEYFAPGVGLVKREEDSFAGTVETVLVEARIDGSMVPGNPVARGFGALVKADAPVYTNNLMPPVAALPKLEAELVVFNHSNEPVTFNFICSQRFDFIITNSDGEKMYRWSDGRGFMDVLGSETLANGMLRYRVSIPLDLGGLKPYPDGIYTLEGRLTSNDRPMRATLTFQVRSVH